jgi:hypothetical protein
MSIRFYATNRTYTTWKWWTFNYYVYFIITVNTYLFKYVPVKLDFIILSIIGVLRIPEEFHLYKDKDLVKFSNQNDWTQISRNIYNPVKNSLLISKDILFMNKMI